jgi:hypothetical protein
MSLHPTVAYTNKVFIDALYPLTAEYFHVIPLLSGTSHWFHIGRRPYLMYVIAAGACVWMMMMTMMMIIIIIIWGGLD